MRQPSLKASDFHRALGTRPVSRTAHFALHVLPVVQKVALQVAAHTVDHADLSTPAGGDVSQLVDDCALPQPDAACVAWRLGLVLPKKQAKRSVTRALIRHQAKEALRRHAPAVRATGQHGAEVDGWVLRLKAPFDRQQFPSAASVALNQAVRAELDELWRRLCMAPAASARGGA